MAETVGLVLLGLAVLVAAHLIARRTALPAAVLLVLAGLAYAWLPGPNVELRPTFLLHVVIPPLLYATALNSSAIGLRQHLRSVTSLSFGLVLVTALVVGFSLVAVVPGLPLAAGLAIGAAVAPPDPVAALAVGRRAGIPDRLMTIIEGEGLLNDAVALTMLQLSVSALSHGTVSVGHAAGELAVAAAGGAAVGLAVAVLLAVARRAIDDPLADTAISLGTPFAAYLAAESFGGSGVLAVVVAGLWFAHAGPAFQSGRSRLQSRAAWSLVQFLLEGFVFLLIGQQFRHVIAHLDAYSATTVLAAAAVSVAVVVGIRPIWLLVSEGRRSHLGGHELIALSWCGTRGVITLAAAFSLPMVLADGAPFHDRDLLLFCGYIVVLATLVGQGLLLGPLARRLRFVVDPSAEVIGRNRARAAAVHAALQRLDALAIADCLPAAVTDPLRREAIRRLDRYGSRISGAAPLAYQTAARVRHDLISVERAELLRRRDAGKLSDRGLQVLLRELDYEEARLPDAIRSDA